LNKALLIVLLISTNAYAFDEWSTRDVVMESAYATVHILDWGQTRHLAKDPLLHHEHNVVLGQHPSVTKVDTYFALTLLAHIGITHIIPDYLRPYWQSVSIIIEGNVVKQNYNLGVRATF
jgi:hypothetical protein